MSVSPLSEIEYRTRWLLDNFGDGLPPEVLREELDGIAMAAQRIYDRVDSLTAVIERANECLASCEAELTPPGPRRHLTLVPPLDSQPQPS